MVFAPNLGWRNVDIKQYLEKATGLPVEVDNAANSNALFEMWFGKNSEGLHDLIALTVSEGIGTGIIANDQLITGPTGMAGEFGHVSINEDGPLCRCGNTGCWEAYASNIATINYYSRAVVKSRNGKGSKDVSMPTFEDILSLCDQGDAMAIEAIDRMAHYLGVGIAMLVTSFAPSVIVCIGEFTRAWDRVEPIINKVVSEKTPSTNTTKIIALDEMVYPRLRGAIALVLQKHFVAPSVA
jgi:predicted NBD/HSP70 family sugar kinase